MIMSSGTIGEVPTNLIFSAVASKEITCKSVSALFTSSFSFLSNEDCCKTTLNVGSSSFGMTREKFWVSLTPKPTLNV